MSDFNELSKSPESYDKLREKAFSIIESSTLEDLNLCLSQYREKNDLDESFIGISQNLSSINNEDADPKQNLIDTLDSLLEKKLEPMRQKLSKNRELLELLAGLLMFYINTDKQPEDSMQSESTMYSNSNTMSRNYSIR